MNQFASLIDYMKYLSKDFSHLLVFAQVVYADVISSRVIAITDGDTIIELDSSTSHQTDD